MLLRRCERFLDIGLQGVLGICLLALSATRLFAFGSREIPITNPFDGQQPYLFVVNDPTGISNRAPGIYAADPAGVYQPIHSGEILQLGANQGVVKSFEISQFTSRHEMAAVVNGKIVFFQQANHESPLASDSVIEIGSEGFKVVDPLTGETTEVPKVKSLEDISIATFLPEGKGQIVLISLRAHADDPQRMTFGLFLKPKADGKSWRASQEASPFYLDGIFRQAGALSALHQRFVANSEEAAVFSTRIINMYAKQKQPQSESLFLQKWRSQLKDAVKDINANSVYRMDASTVPYVDLRDGQIKMTKKIIVSLSTEPRIDQYHDPLRGEDSVIFTDRQNKVHRETGTVARASGENGTHHVYPLNLPDGPNAVIVLNNIFYFYKEVYSATHGTEIVLTKLSDREAEAPDRVSVSLATLKKVNGTDIYVFISVDRPSGNPYTDVYVLTQYDSHSIALKKRLHLLDAFLTAAELPLRIDLGTFYAQESVLFDHLTPVTGLAAKYNKALNPSQPFFDVSATETGAQPKLQYKKIVDELPITGPVTYVHFDETKHQTQASGVMLKNADNKIEAQYPGELLKVAGRKGEFEHILASKAIKIQRSQSLFMHVVATDPTFDHGKALFSAQVVLSHFPMDDNTDNAAKKMPPIIWNESFSFPFSSLENVAIYNAGDPLTDIELLFTFRIGDKGFVITKPIVVPKIKYGQPDPPTGRDMRVLIDTFVSPDEMRSRLLSSHEGHLYFVTTPHLPTTDIGYKIVGVGSGDEILVNSPRGRALRLAELKQSKDEGGDYSYGFGSNEASWRRYSSYGLRDYLRNHNYASIPEKDEKFTKKTGTAIEQEFEGLNTFLEDMVDLGKRKRHLVLVTTDESKEALMKSVAILMTNHANNHWTDANGKTNFYHVQDDKASQEEVIENLQKILQLGPATRNILLADARDLVSIDRPVNPAESDASSLKIKNPLSPNEEMLPHILYLMGVEGEKIEIDQLASHDRHPRMRQLIIASQKEWMALEQKLREFGQEGVLDRYEVNRDYFSLNWRIWPPKSPHAQKDIVALQGTGSRSVENQILPSLVETFENIADISKPARHIVIMVPADIKAFARKTALSSWVNTSGRAWSQSNPALRLHELRMSDSRNNILSQNEFIQELVAANHHEKQRSVLLVDGNLLANGRFARLPNRTPASNTTGSENEPYQISDFATPDEASQLPHLLYMISDEGKLSDTKRFRDNRDMPHQSSVVIFATEAEWNAIKSDTALEQRFGLLERFEFLSLESPSVEKQIRMAEEVFETPEAKMLGFQFDLEDQNPAAGQLSQEQKRKKLMSYMVSRIKILSDQQRQEQISAFLNVLRQLNKTIFEDPAVRNSGRISKKVIERILSKSFGIPLNLNILPPDDPLLILAKENKAAYLLQQAGYEGSLEVKLKYIRAIVSQTRSAGETRNIPSSIVIFGESSTGKTFLFESFVKMLKLKLYKFDAENPAENEDAEAMILKFTTIRGKEKDSKKNNDDDDGLGHDAGMTPAEAIQHIERFIASPRGFRGYLLLDDVHKARPADRWAVMSYVQSLFDTPNGIVVVKDANGNKQEVSLKNFNIQMTVNPPDDPQVISSLGYSPSNEQLIVARLKDKECPFDISALKRWSTLINLSKFPVSAKAPKLRATLVQASSNEFNVGGRLTLVAPMTIHQVVGQFKDANAREFIGEATARLLATAGIQGTDGKDGVSSIEMILPRAALGMKPAKQPVDEMIGSRNASAQRDTDKVAMFIEEEMIALPIQTSSFEGKPYLLAFIVDSYRTSLYERLISSAMADERFVQQPSLLLTPFLHAGTSQLILKPMMDLRDFRLDPADFGLGIDHYRYRSFRETLGKLYTSQEKFFPLQFNIDLSSDLLFRTFTDHRESSNTAPSRMTVLMQTKAKIFDILKRYQALLLRVDNISQLPTTYDWLKQMKEEEPRQEMQAIGKQLMATFLEFLEDMTNGQIVENQTTSGHFPIPTSADLARLYFLVIDKATAELPWGKVLSFLVGSLERAAREADLGQLPGIQSYLFNTKNRNSLLQPAVHEGVLQLAAGSDAFKTETQEQILEKARRFDNACASLFVPSNL